MQRVAAGLTFTVREIGASIELVVTGEWDLATQFIGRDAIVDALARSPRFCVLDLSALEFMDSSAVHCICELNDRCADQGIQLEIIPAPWPVQRILEVTGVGERLPFLEAAR
jgi:anti-sigma B factor antagonist